MTDKILCPWCGRNMEIYCEEQELEDYIAWSSCTYGKCAAEGPFIRGAKTEEEAIRLATEAAIRRYEPSCRPLTLEEAEKADYCYVTLNTFHECASFIAQIGRRVRRSHENIEVLAFGVDEADCMEMRVVDYGKTWRCWPRKPTDAEREAAGWEDAE